MKTTKVGKFDVQSLGFRKVIYFKGEVVGALMCIGIPRLALVAEAVSGFYNDWVNDRIN